MGQDPTLPSHTLLLGDGHVGSGPLATKVPLTAASQRFYHILHVAASAGEHEKVVQVTMLYLKPLRGAEGQEASIWQCFSSPDSEWDTLQMVLSPRRNRRVGGRGVDTGHREASEKGWEQGQAGRKD